LLALTLVAPTMNARLDNTSFGIVRPVVGEPTRVALARNARVITRQLPKAASPRPGLHTKRLSPYSRGASTSGKCFSRPPGFDELTDAELDAKIEEAVLSYEKEQREKREKEGKPFLCDAPQRKPNPWSFPTSPHKLFGLSPQIGAKKKERRLAAIARLREFRRKHEIARLRRKAGEDAVVFPHGTFLAVQRWGVAVEPAPS